LEGAIINFSEYCNKIKPCLKTGISQGTFVTRLFGSAGSNYFQPGSDQDYQKKLFSGKKHLSDNIKSTFPSPIKTEDVSSWLASVIEPTKVRVLLSSYGVPTSAEENINALTAALACQFQKLVEADGDDVNDIVALEYQSFVAGDSNKTHQTSSPLYPGDEIWVEHKPSNVYSMHCYEKLEHTFVLHNNGSIVWRDRKLVFVNQDSKAPRPEITEILVPETQPKGIIKIAASFATRGTEGSFNCSWVMQDIDGNDCFPNNKAFCITIKVKYKKD